MRTRESREISVFIASPGDLSAERELFKNTIDTLNEGFAEGARVKFVPLGWEELPAQTGQRNQSVINELIRKCDVFVLALNRRWGQPAPDSKYSSYTEEEFELAKARWRKSKSPKILIFFKTVDNASLGDPGPELSKVIAFRKKLEANRNVLYKAFASEIEFGETIDEHLRLYALGKLSPVGEGERGIALPKAALSELSKSDRQASKRMAKIKQSRGGKKMTVELKADLSLVESEQKSLALARAAVDASRAGRIQDASILFAQATAGTNTLSVLSIAAEFYRKIGDLESSGRLVKRQASIARDRTIAARHYMKLLPANWLSKLQGQMLDQMLIQFPDEIADEVRSIFEEIYGRGRFEQYMLEILVKYYSTAELLALARYMGSPEGQSSLQKQPLILQETMTFGAAEFQRVLRKRHPELFEDAEPGQNLEAAQPNPLLATGGIGEPVLLGAGGDSDGDSETDN